MPAPEPTTLFTVGHGARPIEEFVAILEGAGIERLVDVRTASGSRKHPQYGKDALAERLEADGIEYVWRRDLGGWRKPDPDTPTTWARSSSTGPPRGSSNRAGSEAPRSCAPRPCGGAATGGCWPPPWWPGDARWC